MTSFDNPQKKFNLFILGAQKCGTTTLFNNLITHPNIHGCGKKELHYFSLETNYLKGNDYYQKKYFQNIDVDQNFSYFIDATPIYLYLPYCPKRIFLHNSNAKLIVLLRDPIERAYSAWNMYKRINKWSVEQKIYLFKDKEILYRCKEDLKNSEFFFQLLWAKNFPSFEEMVEEDLKNIQYERLCFIGLVNRGIYVQQIMRFLEYFKKEQLLILSSESISNKKKSQLQRIFKFLDLQESDWSRIDIRDYGTGKYTTEIPPPTKDMLKSFYQPYNEDLFDLLKCKLW